MLTRVKEGKKRKKDLGCFRSVRKKAHRVSKRTDGKWHLEKRRNSIRSWCLLSVSAGDKKTCSTKDVSVSGCRVQTASIMLFLLLLLLDFIFYAFSSDAYLAQMCERVDDGDLQVWREEETNFYLLLRYFLCIYLYLIKVTGHTWSNKHDTDMKPSVERDLGVWRRNKVIDWQVFHHEEEAGEYLIPIHDWHYTVLCISSPVSPINRSCCLFSRCCRVLAQAEPWLLCPASPAPLSLYLLPKWPRRRPASGLT